MNELDLILTEGTFKECVDRRFQELIKLGVFKNPDKTPDMSEEEKVGQEWAAIFSVFIDDFRRRKPEDTRGDIELLDSLMEYMVKKGTLKKAPNGKYILPTLDWNKSVDIVTNQPKP